MVYGQEKIKPYSDNEGKGVQVELMFDNIAHSYDKLNHRLSWNIDKIWRRNALKKLSAFKPETVLDIATGTGDFAILEARMLHPQKIVGVDISEGMMSVGQKKAEALHLDKTISFKKTIVFTCRSTTIRSTP